jgi:hypothetical protein
MRLDGTLLPPVPVPDGEEALDALGTGPGGDVHVISRGKLHRMTPAGVADTVVLRARDYRTTFQVSPNGSTGQMVAGPGGSLWLASELRDGGSTGGIAVVNLGERCFVPELQLMTLSEARRQLRLHGCRLGGVRRSGRPSPTDGVQCASARPGRVLGRRARVTVTLHPFASRERRC